MHQVEYWSNIEDEDLGLPNLNFWKTPNWGERTIGEHGYLFVGSFCDNTKVLFPVLLLTDNKGNYVDFDEDDLLPELEKIEDEEIFNFHPTDEENRIINNTYSRLLDEMTKKYNDQVVPIKEYNKKKMENWEKIQQDQFYIDLQDKIDEVEEYTRQAEASDNFLEKVDLKKKAKAILDKVQDIQGNFHKHEDEIHQEALKTIEEFDKQFDINPLLLIKIVLKF